MRLRRAFAAHSLSVRHLLPKSALALTAASLLLAGCGGGGSSDDTELEPAFTVIGQSSFVAGAANAGSTTASAATLNSPRGNVAVNDTMMFIADTANNRVLGYSSIPSTNGASADIVLGQGDFTGKTASTSATGLAQPNGVFVDSDYLVVADSGNNRVLIWKGVPTASGTAPTVVIGQADFTSLTSGTSQTALSGPTSAIITPNHKLVVADRGNNRVLIWNTVPTTSNAPADLVLGQADFTSSVHDDEAYSLYSPSSLWSDGYQLFVSDTGNHRVLFWSNFPQDMDAPATYVVGQTDFSRSSAGTSSSTLRSPWGITSDNSGFYVADVGNNRVLKFDSLPSSNNETASFVYGQDDSTFTAATANDEDQDGSKDDTPEADTLNGPTGVFDYNGVLYVTDQNNHRVLLFKP